MSLYVLDTDHISFYQKLHPQVVDHVQAIDGQNLAVTISVPKNNCAVGLMPFDKRILAKDWAYLGLRQGIEYFNTIRVLDFSQEAITRYLALRAAKIRVGTQDLRIAAIILSLNRTLVTRNRRDFAQVPGLKIKDWT